MTIRDHSPVAPSGLAMTVACPLSLTLQRLAPELPPTEEILEGQAAHLVVHAAAQGTLWPLGTKFDSNGRMWEVDIDMHTGAAIYAEAVNRAPSIPGEDVKEYARGNLILEQPVKIERIHPECWGTPDARRAFTLEDTRQFIRVSDYKHGHRYVDPFENYQLIGYAIGELSAMGVSPGDGRTVVELQTIQPRSYHRAGAVQSWYTTPFGLTSALTEIRHAVALALGPEPPGKTGWQCLDCRARAMCPLLRKSAMGVVDYAGTAELEALDNVSAGTELGILDDALAALKARRTGLAQMVENELKTGKPVPWYGMEPTSERLTWNEGVTVGMIDTVGKLVGVSLLKPQETVTPTQAKKLGVAEPVINAMATRQPGGVSLKRTDPDKARKVFNIPSQ